ncbi:hypothetical protein BJY01DRAFT_217335 [Aspergillus pseudoustus]|uniref:PIG-P-domain-containing protein n=1 Tax=Aspergillus pseudoustus TaxID=1810923 RepID=A0ABR4JNF0_9EURO
MEDAIDDKAAAPSLDNEDRPSSRAHSESAGSGHKRSSSGSLLSRLSFLRMMQAGQNPSERGHQGPEANDDRDDLSSTLRGGRAMSSALQQRRTRRRRGSLRKTALLGTRFDYRDKKATRPLVDAIRGDVADQLQIQAQAHQPPLQPPPVPIHTHTRMRSFADSVPLNNGFIPAEPPGPTENNASTWTLMDVPQRARNGSAHHHQPMQSKESLTGGDITTDDEDIVSFPPGKVVGPAGNAFRNSSNTSSTSGAGMHLTTPGSSADSYYSMQADQKYKTTHRAKSPLATHAVDITGSQEVIGWDYSETEWWGWIILIVTWLVFVVGMGSCFGVWSWAWDVGETPYAPPELEDDPTLPIVGYYPALIILTAVMSWVWVVVAWVGMKYFKHANITGDDT